jgi:hypothetical protein
MHLALLMAIAVAATFEPENLKGITSMRVVVENVPGADKVGLDPDVVQDELETNLRKAGIKVSQIAGILPYVHLQMNVLSLPDGCVVYSVRLSLKTGADVVGTKRLIMGDLWTEGILRARCKTDKKDKTDVAKIIRQTVIDETTKMANDILAANKQE